MNRKLLAFIALVCTSAIFFAFTQSIAVAAPRTQESEPTAETTAVTSPTVTVSPTIRVRIQQRIPFTVTLPEPVSAAEPITGAPAVTDTEGITESVAQTPTAALTETGTVDAGRIVTYLLDLELDFLVSETMTMTVPATLTIMQADGMTDTVTGTLPVSVEYGVSPTAMVTVTALALTPAVTETDALTTAAEITAPTEITPTTAITAPTPVTPTADVTATTPVTTPEAAVDAPITETTAPTAPGTGAIQATTVTTANVRTGPGTDFDIADTLSPGTAIEIVAVSEDGAWYLLSSAAWIFNTLVQDVPDDIPVATPELIEQVTQEAAAAQPTPEPEPAATPEPPAEEAPAAETPATGTPASAAPTVTVDANLRSGPGTDFEVIGGTITGQALNIIGQNEAGDWYLLDNGGWVFANLVANPPADIPVVPDDATPESLGAAPVQAEAPAAAGSLLPTPTPAAPQGEQTDATTGSSIDLGLEETLYIDEINNIVGRYNTTASTVERLVTGAAADAALLQDSAWQGQINTAIQVLQRTGEEIRNVDVPPLFAAPHIDFVNAAGSFDQAAELFGDGLAAGDLATMQQGVAEFAVGQSLLARGQEQLAQTTQ
jgi:uncharacterized protein YgiM (DUF1202 family)